MLTSRHQGHQQVQTAGKLLIGGTQQKIDDGKKGMIENTFFLLASDIRLYPDL